MINDEVAQVFERIADLLEIDGAETFRISSYRRAARTIQDTTEDIGKLARAGELTDLPGIGKGMAERIVQYLVDGQVDQLAELEERLPVGLLDLLEIPGLGPKKVAVLYRELGVANLDHLQRVIDSGELERLKGFGKTSVARIADGITFLRSRGGRVPLGMALTFAEALRDGIARWPGVQRVEIAGSLRRGCETVGDVDLLCEANDGADIVQRFTELKGIKRVIASGDTKGSVSFATDDHVELQVDLRVVPTESFGAALQYFTGSKEHNVRLRERAVKHKWRLNEYGLFGGGNARLAGVDEQSIYERLFMPWVPPELREDRGEFDRNWRVPELVTLDDIRGDMHMHTRSSDGRDTIEDMARAARDKGYEYIAVTDHTKSSTIANGLSIERMWEQIEAIRSAERAVGGIHLLAGCECDILMDGSLDYPNELLAACDWVVASIHTGLGRPRKGRPNQTERSIAALQNPHVRALGHPTGRLINQRPAMELDMERIVEVAAETRTCLELNGHQARLDLKDAHVRMAIAAGVRVVINTDAHAVRGLNQMRYGVLTARRGGARVRDVFNAQPWSAVREQLGLGEEGNR